ncbi:MAG: methionyl-tRNA formyltransferase, partial [Rhodothermales bacterium]|nr:methionyl-tRNA formyltransferase [Rhodothermales bacterium]
DGPHAAFVAGDGKALRLVEVQPDGGRKMPGEAWLRGVGR